jgi:spore coat polysaccharide biosynthesis protein SpsF
VEALMRPVIIVQARMGSTRLPGKVMRLLMGMPMLWHIVQRVRLVPGVVDVAVATSDLPADEPIRNLCREHDIPFFAGSERDVLDRYYQAALRFQADPIIRITGDCPFVDPEVVGHLLDLFKTGLYDHTGIAAGAGAALVTEGRFPSGMDAECFAFAALKRAWSEAMDPLDREHVTPYLWRVTGRFRVGQLKAAQNYTNLRWTVDTEADFQMASRVYEALYHAGRPFHIEDIMAFLAVHPEVAAINQALMGREGHLRFWQVEQEMQVQGPVSL